MVQASPAAALEVVEAELLLHLLVHLLADPAALDQRSQALQRGVLGRVAQVVLAPARGPALAHQPCRCARQAPIARDHRTIGHPDPKRGEVSREIALGAAPPRKRPPVLVRQVGDDRPGAAAPTRGSRMLGPPAGRPHRGWRDRNISGVDRLKGPNAHRPGETLLRQLLPEVGHFAVLGIRQHRPEAPPSRLDAIDLLQGDLPFGPARDRLRHPGPRPPCCIVGPSSRQEQAQTGASPRASVSETRAWQLAFLPN